MMVFDEGAFDAEEDEEEVFDDDEFLVLDPRSSTPVLWVRKGVVSGARNSKIFFSCSFCFCGWFLVLAFLWLLLLEEEEGRGGGSSSRSLLRNSPVCSPSIESDDPSSCSSSDSELVRFPSGCWLLR